MKRLRSARKWIELAVGLEIATAAAVALWSAGLSEVAWTPYFFVAALTAKRTNCLALLRGGARS